MSEKLNKILELASERRGSAAVVTIRGSVSISDAERLAEKLETFAAEKVPIVVLDLGEMDFICSAGLGAIISCHVKSRHHHGVIKLVAPRPAVRELFETTRLTKLFEFHDSVEDALAV